MLEPEGITLATIQAHYEMQDVQVHRVVLISFYNYLRGLKPPLRPLLSVTSLNRDRVKSYRP